MAENIVEAIFVKLGLDASQYNREADKAKKSNDSLNKSVGETDKVVGAVTKRIAKWFSILAVGTGVAKMIDQVQKLNDELFLSLPQTMQIAIGIGGNNFITFTK